MKRNRLTTGSFLAVLTPLVGLAASMVGALPARGAEMPFAQRVITTAYFPHSVFAADVDGDGHIDVLSASTGNDKVAWYESDGGSPPTFTERVISTAEDSPYSVFATDLDGDGDIDVLSASAYGPNYIAWYESDGGSPPTFTERVISTNANRAVSVFATDMDGDGDTDVLATAGTRIEWYENDGGSPPAFTEHVISTDTIGANSVFATDLDGDGDTDVLSSSWMDDKIAWYESDGGSPPTFTEHVISTTADSASSVFATDLDGDGDTDVLSTATLDDKIAWYENDGGSPPTFTERIISTNANRAFSVFAMDMDGDGDTDILSASASDNKIAWYENEGGSPPTFTERVISTTTSGANFVFATDLDGDGDTDVLASSIADHKITWYENTPTTLELGPNPFAVAGGGALNRVGGFAMPVSLGGQEVAIRITLAKLYVDTDADPVNGCPVRTGLPDLTAFDGKVRYLGPPSAFNDNAVAAPQFVAAELQCTPFYRDWSPAALTADFGAEVDTDKIYYYGTEVVPCSVYEAQQATQACVESANPEDCFSRALEIRTALWGDVWPPFGRANMTDVGKLVDGFKDIPFDEGPPPHGAPRKVRAMLRGNSAPLDSTVNFTDIGRTVDAFKTIAYAEDGPTACP